MSGEVTGMRMRKLILAAMVLAMAMNTHAVARNSHHGHSRGHARHSETKPASPSDASSAKITPAASEQRHPDDLALDRKIKNICRGC
jgi:hypothetical protein